jgi:hypothetical protein
MEQDLPPPASAEAGMSAKEGGAGAAASKSEPHPPSKKYRTTDAMKTIVWQLVSLSNECCRLENEKK